MARFEPIITTQIFYLNNSPHIVRFFATDEKGETILHSERRFQVAVVGSPGPVAT